MITDIFNKLLHLPPHHGEPITLPLPRLILAYGLAGEQVRQRNNVFDWQWKSAKRIISLPRDIQGVRKQLRILGEEGKFLPVLLVDGNEAVDIPDICGEDWPNFEIIDAVVTPSLALETLYAPERGVIHAWQALCAGETLANAAAPWSDVDFSIVYGELFGRWLLLQIRKELRLGKPLDIQAFRYAGSRAGCFVLRHPGFPLARLELRPQGQGWHVTPCGALAAVDANAPLWAWDRKNYSLADLPDAIWNRLLPADAKLFTTIAMPSGIQRIQGVLDWLVQPLAELSGIAAIYQPAALHPVKTIPVIDQGPVVILTAEFDGGQIHLSIKWLETPLPNPPGLNLLLNDTPIEVGDFNWEWSSQQYAVQLLHLTCNFLSDTSQGVNLAVAWDKAENRLHLRWLIDVPLD